MKVATTVALILLALTTRAMADDLKIGVIEPDRVLNGTKSGQKIKDMLEDYRLSRQRLLDTDAAELETLQENLKKQESVLSPEAKKAQEEVFRQKWTAYQQRVQQFLQEFEAKKSELRGEFTKQMARAAQDIAEREKISLIVEKMDGGATGLILFSHPSIDVTDRVIKALDSAPAK